MISRLTYKMAIPVILVGIFVITIFISLNYQNLNWSFYLVLFFLLVFVFFYGVATGQSLTKPVRKLLERATDLSKGDFKSRVYLESKDEVAELAQVFNEIAEKLEESQLNEQKTQKSVDIKVRAKTQALEETIDALEQKIKNRTFELQRLEDDAKRLRQEVQAREAEIQTLRNQINDFKSSMGRHHTKKDSKEKSENAS